ncbi:nucleolar protein 11-like [Nannospalax galili]|uniref:nucleolar protein 11-like n=1 Tax=Nannospalax galili TaxID=1026970 RepID=UPI0004ED2EF1|nr:nucleolar protein 11-like [Nannospalax galili]
MFKSHNLSKYTLLLGKEEKSITPKFTAYVDQKFISLMSLSSDGCIYETLIPTYSIDTEKNQRLVRSLVLKAVVSGGARNRTTLTILDQDHVAVLGPPLPASKEDSEKHIEVELRKFLATSTPDFHTLLGDVVTGPMGRRKAEPSFYPQNCLMQLIQTHVLSYSLCPGLMEIALERADVQMLQLCLQQFPDIPESATCACLKLFLSIGDDSLQDMSVSMESVFDCSDTMQDEEMEEQTEVVQNGFSPKDSNCSNENQELSEKPGAAKTVSCPVTPKRAALLNGILHSAYSETFLLPHLKDIPAQHIVLLLQYLNFLYLRCGNAAMTLPGVNPPTLSQIMDWICLLLDANFTVVLMIPEAKRLLTNLYKFVKSQGMECEDAMCMWREQAEGPEEHYIVMVKLGVLLACSQRRGQHPKELSTPKKSRV